MKKPSLLFICFSFILFSYAQQVQYLTANNINAGFGIGGNLFSRLDSIIGPSYIDTIDLWDLYQAPNGLGPRAIYTATLWMSGLDNDSIQHCAGQTYKANGGDYFDGPIIPVYDAAYDNYYKRVFKISETQVAQFRVSWVSSINPNNIDSAIRFWPGYKNPLVDSSYGVDITSPLAPFVDVNGDGIYNPIDGDYPSFCGDEAIFFVFNDARGPHLGTGSTNPLGFEVRGLAYVFEQPDSTGAPYEKNAVNNNVFVRYDIENKSVNNYSAFYLSLFEDPDLGCYENDRIGCDTVRNLMFVYNGTEPDPDCGIEIGYQYVPVSHGIKMLNQKMSAFGYYDDANQLCNPTDSIQFIYPGDPNDTSQWSEMSLPNQLPPGERKDYGKIGPMSFNSGETKHFDFAFLISYDTTSTMLGIVDTLKRDADIVQQFYDSTIIPCINGLQIASVNNISNNQLLFSVFPNPSNNKINIQSGQQIQVLEISDILGQAVLKKHVNNTHISVDISSLPKGVYLVVARNGNSMAVKKLIID